jgi:hypothetical protein
MNEILEALSTRPFPAKVAAVQSPFTVVINRGSKDKLRLGQRFIVYGLGPEIRDPDTGQSLGVLEVVRGTGVVTHLQDMMATVEADQKRVSEKRIVRTPNWGIPQLAQETVVEPSDPKPFDEPAIGDLAKPI